jgi:CDP-glucose 4,6-dehydratase
LEGLALKRTYPQPDLEFWRGRKVFVTGHTGFKGSWLTFWLVQLGAKVCGCSLPPSTQPSLFNLLGVKNHIDHHVVDIRKYDSVSKTIKRFKPDVIIHLAAQALVLPSLDNPLKTFETNVLGTLHLLEAVREINTVRAIVVVTSDKVYRNIEVGRPFREFDCLGGKDPYSASKAASEMVINCYRASFLKNHGIAISAVRAGNVIGGGDWSMNRIIPDAIRAWSSKKVLIVRNPLATRPWQHVLEPLAAYLRLAELLITHPSMAEDYNIGPCQNANSKVKDVIIRARNSFGLGKIKWEKPIADSLEAQKLSLDAGRARRILGIKPVWGLNETISRTVHWYRKYLKGEDVKKLCHEDIKTFLDSR